MNQIVLQEKRTLDEVLLSSVKTFRNGCNYRLVKEINNKYYLEYGCYGVLVNLLTGDKKLLHRWFTKFDDKAEMRLISGEVNSETIAKLLEKAPCKLCGGTRFRRKII